VAGRQGGIAWTERARDGLDEAIAFIAEDSPEGARKVLVAALKMASSLGELSLRGRMVHELGVESVREVFVFRYRLIYEVTETDVIILAFLHGARDFDRWMSGR